MESNRTRDRSPNDASLLETPAATDHLPLYQLCRINAGACQFIPSLSAHHCD
ncbi:hypothetical protein EVA_10433 [gut metagenome]|uniref:Uncharacterized protein n=1 Tax=gut metagenome TaxID=749906 RepID=J9G2K4_9ZZZZ